ncbi:zinc-binding dehydrogenase [Acinetobacter gerneri]|uniref:zinc-binding dehydrogenase n=1 Tax=Acinetobacter gerneri TaxID=202952 RepID=UPI003215F153
MKAIIHTEFGEPEIVLHTEKQPIPEPAADEVRIKTILTPIHNHDIWTVRGRYGYKPTFPAIGGSEAVGIIDAIGSNVTHVQVGQRIAVASVHGTWAEYFIAPARGVIPLPDEIPDEIAAQLIAMPMSSAMLLDFLKVKSGDWIIQNAASGAVGKTLAMLAKPRGINVISLVRRDIAIAELKELGIEYVVSTAQEDWKTQVKEIVADQPIIAAVDSIGGTASSDLVELLGENGTLVSFGTMKGEAMQIPSGDLIFKQATVKGFWGAKVSRELSSDNKKRLITELMQAVLQKTLKLPVEAIFSLDDIKTASLTSLKQAKKGKVLLKP